MKKVLTENLGLKILSVLAAIVLWLVVVNVDDPVITRTYSNIPVEIVNTDVITKEGKTYEVLEGTDTVTVVVQASRSVIEAMSRDYIRAIADMKDITIMNTVAIDIKSTRYSDRIESITSSTKNLKVSVEEMKEKEVDIHLELSGMPEDGYVVGKLRPSVKQVTVSGPESLVDTVSYAKSVIDVRGLSNDVEKDSAIVLYDEENHIIEAKNIVLSVSSVHSSVDMYETKEVGLVFNISGNAADGYGSSGVVGYTPETVVIAGEGDSFDAVNSIVVPDELSIEGATDDVTVTIDIREYLPKGVVLANANDDGLVTAVAYVDAYTVIDVDVPVSNVSITNIPEGFAANVVSESNVLTISVHGTDEALKNFNTNSVTGTIDASALTPKLLDGENLVEGNIHTGINSGLVNFDFPAGIGLVTPTYATVNLVVFDSNAVIHNTEYANENALETEAAQEGTESDNAEEQLPAVTVPEEMPVTEVPENTAEVQGVIQQ